MSILRSAKLINRLPILFSIIIFLPLDTHAAEFQLHKIAQMEFEKVTSKISNAIEADDNKKEILPFDSAQSFSVSSNGNKVGNLIPVKFNSKHYRNTICRLYFLDTLDNVQSVKLFAEKNDEDDIVASCIRVEAVSIQSNENETDSFNYFAIVRIRLANTYQSIGVVVSLNKNSVSYDEKLNTCLLGGSPISSISLLKQKVATCSKNNKAFEK